MQCCTDMNDDTCEKVFSTVLNIVDNICKPQIYDPDLHTEKHSVWQLKVLLILPVVPQQLCHSHPVSKSGRQHA